MRPTFFILALVAALPPAPVRAEGSDQEIHAGSGYDLLRPLRRLDLRLSLEGDSDETNLTATLRSDAHIDIDDRSRVNLRIDVPFKNREFNVNRGAGFGLSDVQLQAMFVRELATERGFGVGAQLIVPTAVQDKYGRGKWRIRPTAGYRLPLSSLSDGSFFQLIGRFDYSFAGDNDREKVRELMVAPNLEMKLPGRAYVAFFPSTDIRYNFVTDEFFLPVDVEVGKHWKRAIVSIEVAKGLISGKSPPYSWKVESRIALRF